MNAPQPDNLPPQDPWQQVSWEAHEKAQLKRMALIPFPRKLEMLEEMHQMFLQMQKKPPRPAEKNRS